MNGVGLKAAQTFHCRDVVSTLFKGVLGEAFTLEDGRLLDGLQTDVVIRSKRKNINEKKGSEESVRLTERNTTDQAYRRVLDLSEAR